MRLTAAFLLLIALSLLVSCSKDLITPLSSEKIAVVESYLYAGDSVITVKVSKVLPFSEDTLDATEYISGLSLYINGAPLTETEAGSYQLSLGGSRLQPGETYKLQFLYYGDTVSSTTTIPDTPVNFTISSSTLYADRVTSSSGFGGAFMDQVELSWDNDDESYYYLTVEYLEDTPDYINSEMADYDISGFRSQSPVQSAGTRLDPHNLQFFGSYRIVLYKVNKEFVDLYQHLTANSNNITEPVTAVQNGYGVFTGMSSDTVYLEVKEN